MSFARLATHGKVNAPQETGSAPMILEVFGCGIAPIVTLRLATFREAHRTTRSSCGNRRRENPVDEQSVMTFARITFGIIRRLILLTDNDFVDRAANRLEVFERDIMGRSHIPRDSRGCLGFGPTFCYLRSANMKQCPIGMEFGLRQVRAHSVLLDDIIE